MTITEVIQSGDGQVVRIPHGFEFTAKEVAIRRQGNAVILEPIKSETWPEGFFEKIYIDDPAFRRPEQGIVPPAPKFD